MTHQSLASTSGLPDPSAVTALCIAPIGLRASLRMRINVTPRMNAASALRLVVILPRNYERIFGGLYTSARAGHRVLSWLSTQNPAPVTHYHAVRTVATSASGVIHDRFPHRRHDEYDHVEPGSCVFQS